MGKRFDSQPVWDPDWMGQGYPPIVGFIVKDQKNEEDILINGTRLMFEDREHAEIFARVMNFGDKLKD